MLRTELREELLELLALVGVTEEHELDDVASRTLDRRSRVPTACGERTGQRGEAGAAEGVSAREPRSAHAGVHDVSVQAADITGKDPPSVTISMSSRLPSVR